MQFGHLLFLISATYNYLKGGYPVRQDREAAVLNIPFETRKETFTYGDYLKWSDEERWEIISGVPYLMSPAPSPEHQRLSGSAYRIHWLHTIGILTDFPR